MLKQESKTYNPYTLKATQDTELIVHVGDETFIAEPEKHFESILLRAYMAHLEKTGGRNVTSSDVVYNATTILKNKFSDKKVEIWVEIDYDKIPQHVYHAPIPDPPKPETRKSSKSFRISRT